MGAQLFVEGGELVAWIAVVRTGAVVAALAVVDRVDGERLVVVLDNPAAIEKLVIETAIAEEQVSSADSGARRIAAIDIQIF